jgi:polycomb protein EED
MASSLIQCSVAFFNDLILSKCDDENCIVLWAISGFSSKNPIPSPLSAPTTHDSARETRSAFTSGTVSPGTLQYTRLLEFSIPDSELMFMRFSLFPGSAMANPVLAMCNASSKVFFWDLSRLEEYQQYISNLNATERPDSTQAAVNIEPPVSGDQDIKRPTFLVPYKHRNRGGPSVIYRIARDASPVESTSTDSMSNANHSSNKNIPPVSNPDQNSSTDMNGSHTNGRGSQIIIPGLSASDSAKSLEIWSKRYSIGDPHGDIVAHKDEVIRGFDFVGRYVAWSNGGEWCVVVGSAGVIGVFERWQK